MKKSKVKAIHFEILAALIVYFLISTYILINFAGKENIILSFLAPLLFGIISGVVFLYLFSHEQLFPFMKNVKKEEKKKESGYLKKYLHFGKFLACLIIGLVGGPVFLALTVRFLFPRSKNKYMIVGGITIITSVILVLFARSVLSFLF